VLICYRRAVGGVSIVCESLAHHLETRGYSVVRLHSFSQALRHMLKSTTQRRVWVTNIEFGAINLLVKRSLFVLHGFTRRSEGYLKFLFAIFMFRLFCMRASVIVAVSELTRALN
jgi:hypothetical protein